MLYTMQTATPPTTETVQPSVSRTWMNRLRLVQNQPSDLIAFAKMLDASQRAKARQQWQDYKLWRHAQTGEFLGVISPDGKGRRVQRAYNLPYWIASGPDNPFQATISATNSALSRLARKEPEWADASLAAFVNPKHAYIAFLLTQQEQESKS